MLHIHKAPYQIWAKSAFGPWRYKLKYTDFRIRFFGISGSLNVKKFKKMGVIFMPNYISSLYVIVGKVKAKYTL